MKKLIIKTMFSAVILLGTMSLKPLSAQTKRITLSTVVLKKKHLSLQKFTYAMIVL